MLHETFKLRELFPPLAKESIEALSLKRRQLMESLGKENEEWAAYKEPTVTAYCPDVSNEIDRSLQRISVLICPGGAYEFCSFREAEPIALAFTSLGYNAFVLDYSVVPERYPQALLELSAAMALIREKSAYFHADPNKIAVCGFSAGGHLTASLGTFWSDDFINETLGIRKGDNRPDALILNYPVISAGQFRHYYSFECYLGKDAPKEVVERMCLEKQVNDKTPPTFIWHTFDDNVVPVENSLLFATALREHNVPFELHIFPKGKHGLSLCSKVTSNCGEMVNPHCENWFKLCDEWLEIQFATK